MLKQGVLKGDLVVETTKVTASKMVIMTAAIFLREVTLAIEQKRGTLSVEAAGVAMVVAKTVANVMTHGMMMSGITRKRSRTAVSHVPLAKMAVTPGGLTRAAIGSVDAIEMTHPTQGRM